MSNVNPTAGGLIFKVPGIEGVFTAAHRNMGNQIAIECEYSRLTEGLMHPTGFLGNLSQMVADLTVLIVQAPKWGKTPSGEPTDDIAAMDAFEPDTLEMIQKVWSALRDKEADFRSGRSKAAGSPAGEQADAVVSPPVQPPAD